MARIVKDVTIMAPAGEVYAFAHDPRHWAEWFVGLSGPTELTGEGEAGTVGEFTYKMAGIPFPLTITVTEAGEKAGHFYCKTGFTGPLAGYQVVTFTPQGERTVVAVEVEYTVPGKALGRIADRLVIERMEEHAADSTLANLKALIEAKVPALAGA
jgi:ligand-binding SRPBCC domain-containing protein